MGSESTRDEPVDGQGGEPQHGEPQQGKPRIGGDGLSTMLSAARISSLHAVPSAISRRGLSTMPLRVAPFPAAALADALAAVAIDVSAIPGNDVTAGDAPVIVGGTSLPCARLVVRRSAWGSAWRSALRREVASLVALILRHLAMSMIGLFMLIAIAGVALWFGVMVRSRDSGLAPLGRCLAEMRPLLDSADGDSREDGDDEPGFTTEIHRLRARLRAELRAQIISGCVCFEHQILQAPR